MRNESGVRGQPSAFTGPRWSGQRPNSAISDRFRVTAANVFFVWTPPFSVKRGADWLVLRWAKDCHARTQRTFGSSKFTTSPRSSTLR